MRTQAVPERRLRRLIRAACLGDARAFDDLVRPHLEAGLSVAQSMLVDRHLAEDAVQDALLQVHKNLNGFRGDASFRTWWLRIVFHAAQKQKKRSVRVAARDVKDLDELAIDVSPGAALSEGELNDAFEIALGKLPEKQRITLHLRVREGLSHEEIAQVIGSNREATKMSVYEGRRKLIKQLGAFLPETRPSEKDQSSETGREQR